jgi:hypothetical protein
MGSGWGASADGGAGDGAPDAEPAGEPEPLEFELVDDDTLPGEGPNSVASDRETIGGSEEDGRGGGSRVTRFPRPLRIAAVLAVAVALTFAVWPTAGRREATLLPVPAPSLVNVDLNKVQLDGTSLQIPDGADHAVLGLELTNSAPTRLEVVSAELWDAVGTRIGSAAMWPAEGLGGQSTESVPVTLPYVCNDFGFLPVLPMVIRYSISTPQDPTIRRDYAFPLTGPVWDSYMHQREAQCSGSTNAIDATAIDTSQPIGAPSDPQGFDLTLTLEAAGTTAWNVESVKADNPAMTITGSGMPVAVTPGQTASLATHWHLVDCGRRQPPSTEMTGVEFTARMTNPPPGSGVDPQRVFRARLRPGLVQQMVLMACGG